MYVELHINGELKRHWHFENADYQDAFTEIAHLEREHLWQEILTKCKLEVMDGLMEFTLQDHYEFHIKVPSKVRASDVTDNELEDFNNLIAERREAKYNILKFLRS